MLSFFADDASHKLKVLDLCGELCNPEQAQRDFRLSMA